MCTCEVSMWGTTNMRLAVDGLDVVAGVRVGVVGGGRRGVSFGATLLSNSPSCITVPVQSHT